MDNKSWEGHPQGTYPDGSQYNDEDLQYKDFDGYDLLSDDDEPVYI